MPFPTRKVCLRFGPFGELFGRIGPLTKPKYEPTCSGAEAYGRDDRRAEVHILDAGHFALDLKSKEIVQLVGDFMKKGF